MNNLPQNQLSTNWWPKLKEVLRVFGVPEEGNHFLPRGLESKYLFWYGAGLLVLKIGIIASVLILPSTHLFSDIATQDLLALINQTRQEKNLSPLVLNNRLTSAASQKANDMLANDYFQHVSPAGVTPWYWIKQTGYNFEYAGENLAMDFFETSDVFRAWMNSPTHRDNILNPNYKEIGIAVASGQLGERDTTLAVLDFGSRPVSKSVAVAKSQPSASVVLSPKTTPASSPKISPVTSPSAANQITPTPTTAPAPSVSSAEKEITMKSVLTATTPSASVEQEQTPIRRGVAATPKVLGVFVSRFDEMVKSLYLYFTLLLMMALGVNIFVKIRIQHWPTIAATTLTIILSAVLIFV